MDQTTPKKLNQIETSYPEAYRSPEAVVAIGNEAMDSSRKRRTRSPKGTRRASQRRRRSSWPRESLVLACKLVGSRIHAKWGQRSRVQKTTGFPSDGGGGLRGHGSLGQGPQGGKSRRGVSQGAGLATMPRTPASAPRFAASPTRTRPPTRVRSPTRTRGRASSFALTTQAPSFALGREMYLSVSSEPTESAISPERWKASLSRVCLCASNGLTLVAQRAMWQLPLTQDDRTSLVRS